MIMLDKEHSQKLERLLERRRVKSRLIDLIAVVKKDSKNKKLSVKKGQSYASIVSQLKKCVEDDLLTESQIVEVISESEIAGNQHVMLFEMPSKPRAAKQLWDNLISPKHKTSSIGTVEDFLTCPSFPTSHILSESDEEMTIKLVVERNYWTVNELTEQATLDRRLFERLRQRERSAIILKCNLTEGLVQVRVPPTELGGGGSVKSHFEFASETFNKFYKNAWLDSLESLTITDAFPTLVNDYTTLTCLWSDSPENDSVSSRIKNIGRPTVDTDLRGNQDWIFADGYARDNVSGYFKCSSNTKAERKVLFARLHSDKIRGARTIARLFVPHACKDEELEYVISGIRGHI